MSGGGAAIVAAVIAILAALSLNVPYFEITPGPAINVVDLIAVKGAQRHRVTGQLLLTTVSLHEIRAAEAIRGWFDSTSQIISRSAIVQPGQTDEDVEVQTTQQMQDSQVFAAAAALRYLGYNVRTRNFGVRVASVAIDGPAVSVLHQGDVIVGVDGRSVQQPQDFVDVVQRHKVGDAVSLKLLRGTKTIEVRIETIARPGDKKPIIGVILENASHVDLPLAINIDAQGIGGPSAGLMFAVGIVDLLDRTDLAKGRTIAGTGEITIDGHVREVGGVSQKVVGAKRANASLFLVPVGEATQACEAAAGLPVAYVSTLKDAISVLANPRLEASRSCTAIARASGRNGDVVGP